MSKSFQTRLARIAASLALLMSPLSSGVLLALSPEKAITQYSQDVWTSANGLPQNTLSAIAQTRDGYLWLGTEEGLVRFDGVSFTIFDKSNTDEIKHNYISALYEDQEGSLWVGTEGGLDRFKDGKFTSYTTADGLSNDVVLSIFEDKEGSLWIGTQVGLNRLKDGKFTNFTTKQGLSRDDVRSIYEDKEGSLWIGTHGGGLNRFKDGKFTSFTTKEGLSNDVVLSIFQDKEGSLWIGTQVGLNRFKDGKFTLFTTMEGLSHDSVRAIYEDKERNLWIGTGGGLNRFKDGRFTAFTTKQGLSNDVVLSIFEDKEGSLWVGTYGGGLNRFKDGKFTPFTTKEGLSDDVVYSIYEDREGSFWIGTQSGGLNRFKDGKFTAFTTKQGLSNDDVSSIYEDIEGSLWIGTYGGGLNRFKDGKFTSFTTKEGLSHDTVRAIYEDKEGNLWIGTSGGLNRFKDGKFTTFTTKDGLSYDVVLSIYEDKEGSLWIGTQGGGLNRFKDGKFTTFATKEGLSHDVVLSIYEDKEASLWIGTSGGGLNRFKDGKFTVFTAKHGLFDDLAFQILEDDHENLWMGCNKGIYRVSKKDLNDFADGRISSLTSVIYGIADGMKSNECNSGSPAGWRTRDGRLWFATNQGLAVIDPNNITLNALPPPVFVEKVMIDGNRFSPREKTEAPPGAGELEFQFTALSFVAPKKVRFKYKLEGFDKNWIDAGTVRTAHYTNIPPGNYRFRVIASNNDGVWNEEGAVLDLRLRPHFYQTYWFYFLTAGSLLLLGLTLHRLRVRSLNVRRTELERLVDERTGNLLETTRELEAANRRQADFVSGVSHELKTPLTLIRLYGETLLYGDGFTEEARNGYYEIIARESERLTHLVDNVLDFSRIDRGLKHYYFQEGNMATVVAEIVEIHANYLRRAGFTVHVKLVSDPPRLLFDPAALSEIVLNLLDNAAKYCADNKEISVRLYSDAANVILEIEDHGLGIPNSDQARIFEQFYRANNSSDKGGHGLGLFLVKHIMDAHGGTIDVKSEPGRGSLFRLAFPLNLKPQEKENGLGSSKPFD